MGLDEVVVTVRVTPAERALLRRLAAGHGGDVSEVVADGLLDVLPAALCAAGARRLTAVHGRSAACAVTVWLPSELADLLAPAEERVAELTGVRLGSVCGVLGAAVRLWLGQDPDLLAAHLRVLRARRPAPALAAARAA